MNKVNTDSRISGEALIVLEVARQRDVEGWSVKQDDQYTRREMVGFAIFNLILDQKFFPPSWKIEWMKKTFDKPYKERLVIAGAMIAQELNRLNREENDKRKTEGDSD